MRRTSLNYKANLHKSIKQNAKYQHAGFISDAGMQISCNGTNQLRTATELEPGRYYKGQIKRDDLVSEYPQFKEDIKKGAELFTVTDVPKFQVALKKALNCSGQGELREGLLGINIHSWLDGLRIVGVDGHVLAMSYFVECEGFREGGIDIRLDDEAVNLLLKVDSYKLNFSILDSGSIAIEFQDGDIISSWDCDCGEFIQYKRVLREGYGRTATLNRIEFLRDIKKFHAHLKEVKKNEPKLKHSVPNLVFTVKEDEFLYNCWISSRDEYIESTFKGDFSPDLQKIEHDKYLTDESDQALIMPVRIDSLGTANKIAVNLALFENLLKTFTGQYVELAFRLALNEIDKGHAIGIFESKGI